MDPFFAGNLDLLVNCSSSYQIIKMALNVFGKHPSMTLQIMSIMFLYGSINGVFLCAIYLFVVGPQCIVF